MKLPKFTRSDEEKFVKVMTPIKEEDFTILGQYILERLANDMGGVVVSA